jgi:cytochrome P450
VGRAGAERAVGGSTGRDREPHRLPGRPRPQQEEALGDDLLSALAAEHNAEDGRFSREELIGTASLLLVAGVTPPST